MTDQVTAAEIAATTIKAIAAIPMRLDLVTIAKLGPYSVVRRNDIAVKAARSRPPPE